MGRTTIRAATALALAAAVGLAAAAESPARVYAAASLTDALGDAAAAWEREGHPAPVLVFAASSALAKQIEAGAPGGLYASADRKWMDYLQQRARIAPESRVQLLGNRLVLIAPRQRAPRVELRRGFDFAGSFDGKLCTGETGSVPAGLYARQALEALGFWPALQRRIVGADDVRTALRFVERGECALGIVYATDAAASPKVETVAEFAPGSHDPIVYPFALTPDAGAEARGFLEFLKTAPEAGGIFRHYGFTVLRP